MSRLIEDAVGKLIFHKRDSDTNRHPVSQGVRKQDSLAFFNPLRLPAAATSPDFGGGRVGVAYETSR